MQQNHCVYIGEVCRPGKVALDVFLGQSQLEVYLTENRFLPNRRDWQIHALHGHPIW